MLYLYFHCSSSYQAPREPSVGNHYILIDVDDIEEYDWDVRQESADGNYPGEDEYDWGDWVETEGGTSAWVSYDPTDPVHMSHTGFEDQRPEAVEYHKEQDRLKTLAKEKAKAERILLKKQKVEQLLKEIKELENDR